MWGEDGHQEVKEIMPGSTSTPLPLIHGVISTLLYITLPSSPTTPSSCWWVGGEFVGEYKDGTVTNKLWTLTEHDQWRETLPPMATKRCVASAVEFADNILVAGGEDDNGRNVNIVEVYDGHHWAEAQCLPRPSYRNMKSAVLNGHWYLMEGDGLGKEVYYASLDSLVASCQPSEKPLPSVWKRLPDVPHDRSSTAVFGNRLIVVGGFPASSSIHAYSPRTQSWVHVGDMPVGLHSTCTAVLPTGDLMVIGGWSNTYIESDCMYKAILKFNGKSELYDMYAPYLVYTEN